MRLLLCWAFPSFFSTRHYVSPISYLVFRSSSLLYFSYDRAGNAMRRSLEIQAFSAMDIYSILGRPEMPRGWDIRIFGRLAICRRGIGCTSLGGKSDSAGIPTLSTQFKAKQDLNRLYSSHTGPESKIHASFHLGTIR